LTITLANDFQNILLVDSQGQSLCIMTSTSRQHIATLRCKIKKFRPCSQHNWDLTSNWPDIWQGEFWGCLLRWHWNQ